jgi:hypothetical protein
VADRNGTRHCVRVNSNRETRTKGGEKSFAGGRGGPRRSATMCRQLPHPTEEVHGCRSGDQAVLWQQCGSGDCGPREFPGPQDSEL